MPGALFDLNIPATTPTRRAALTAARPLLNWVLRAKTYQELYARLDGGRPFGAAALDVLNINAECAPEMEAAIPSSGSLIVAANHPHGALDGLLLLDVIGRVRGDVRLLANHLLARVTELRDLCFFVDPFERTGAAERSLAGLRGAHLWLRQGGALIVFPAGEVAHQLGADGGLIDPAWRTTVGRLAIATGARVVPTWIGGGNGRMFRAVGRLHPMLRTVMLPRELLKMRNRSVRVKCGAAMTLRGSGDRPGAAAATRLIREAVERAGAGVPDVQAQLREALAAEVAHLPAAATLVDGGHLQVYCARAEAIPGVLQEIGRLREVSYRAVGEGTGRAVDLDRFDEHYLHLFLWNREQREVVGAYRLAPVDGVTATMGVEGLYTRTLFQYDRGLLDRLPPALELGRSFVRPEYQRSHAALLLLWKGVCAFVSRHPRYRMLFGVVSISARYNDRTRALLTAFLEQNHRDQTLAQLVTATTPYAPARPQPDEVASVPRTIEDADALVARLGGNGGMPVLLRHYLKLNARCLGFNLDPTFADALDALMAVDLTAVDPRLLRRYFGVSQTDAYLSFHRGISQAA
jgi:putative hemolysin